MKRSRWGFLTALAATIATSWAVASNLTAAEPQEPAKSGDKIEVVAYYFGNYHVDARNEKKFGPGWTEWKLVKEAKPRFEGHRQPKVPLWGYTDSANPKDMAQKIDAAHNTASTFSFSTGIIITTGRFWNVRSTKDS